MFGSRLPLAVEYAELLASAGIDRGLLGPREVPRLWTRHLLNCAVVEQLIGAGASVCDVGSGAGLPGLVLALARPDLSVTLVEPLLRRTTFLLEARAVLDLVNVEVVRERAEALHGRRSFTVVTSRAVAPLARLAAWSLPLLAPGGEMLAMKGESAAEELAASHDALARLGAPEPDVVQLPVPGNSSPTTVVRARVDGAQPLGLWPGRVERRPRSPRPR